MQISSVPDEARADPCTQNNSPVRNTSLNTSDETAEAERRDADQNYVSKTNRRTQRRENKKSLS